MISKFIKNNLPKILTVILIPFFFVGLFKNIDYIKFPNSDFFQYINDGHKYLNLKLPDSIHPPPFAPIIICLVSKLFSNVEYPELFSAHLINIICATLSLLNIFFIFSKKKPWFGLLLILLIATNKLYITDSLNITNEVIFTFFLTLVLLLYSKKHYLSSYLLSGLSFFVRYEAIIVVAAIFIIDFFKKNKKIKFFHVFIAIIPIIFWLIILNSHSLGNSIFQNAYIDEVVNGVNNIPNFQPFKSLLDIIFSNPIEYLLSVVFFPNSQFHFELLTANSRLIFSSIILIICFKNVFFKKNTKIIQIIYLIIPSYLVFTAIFPNFNIRYLFPMFWIIYFVLINRKSTLVTIIIFFILLTINLIGLSQYSIHDGAFEKLEYRLVSNWVNQQDLKNTTILFMFDPGAMIYFNKNKSVMIDISSYEDFSNIFTKCNNDILCVINNDDYYDNKEIFVVTQSSTTIDQKNVIDKYTNETLHHISAFHDNKFINNPKFKSIKFLSINKYTWAKIYKYIPPKTP